MTTILLIDGENFKGKIRSVFTVVPIHPGKDIPPGTLHTIIRDINFTPEAL